MVAPALTVSQDGSQYPVYIGAGLLAELPALARAHLPARRTALVTDSVVAPLYQEWRSGRPMPWRPREQSCADELPSGWAEPLVFPAGERHKTRETWQRLTDTMLTHGYGRDSAVLALGGGVTGDLAGFVAATYHRGIPVLQVPTTLLAMLDASIGGKTGVDTAHGKNLVGAFHPPVAVVADLLTLGTLPARELHAGLAEAVKHGLMLDAEHFAWLGREAGALADRRIDALAALVQRSVELKAGVVGGDAREEGRRAVLNAGHTVAHAIERVSDYAVPHGEAVAAGLVLECRLGEALGVTAPGTASQVAALLAALGLPPAPQPLASPAELLEAMRHDKKRVAGGLRFALPACVGRCDRPEGAWTRRVDPAAVAEILAGG